MKRTPTKKSELSPFLESKAPEYVSEKELTIFEARKLLPENLKHLTLAPREYKFLAVYCSNNFNAVDACEKAGYVERTKAKYRAIAYSLLQRKDIIEAIRIYIDTVIQPYKDRLELELLNIYYRRATFDITTFLNDDGEPKKLNEIDKEWLCCVDGVKKTSFGSTELILPNRDTALQALYKFVTGQDVNSSLMLPDEARKRMNVIYNSVIKINKNIAPENIKKKQNIIATD